jgi:glyoxylase-like metal-dependent hydrolase (beta-lactamase superfamily II)
LPVFPNARIYIQKKEVMTWLTYLALPENYALLPGLGVAVPGHFAALIQAMGEHRVTLLDGDLDNVVPGVHIRASFDSHTAGHQYVLIETEAGGKTKTYVYTGDIGYVKENLLGLDDNRQFIINAFASGLPYGVMKAMDDIVKLVGRDNDLLLVGHDEALWTERPSQKGADGLRIAEICLAPGETSKV